MPTETRPMRGRDANRQRYCPFGALVLVVILALADLTTPTDAEEPGDGQA